MKTSFSYKIHYPASNYILLDFGNVIDVEINKYVIALSKSINHEAIIEIIPSYAAILIEYDEEIATTREIIRNIENTKPANEETTKVIHEIPVVYGSDSGPDLAFVANNAGLSIDETIKVHTSVEYRVYMLGFLPGFCYLGGLDSGIACKRLDTPRVRIPTGSVGIAGNQTGIYPAESPGGWQIIGRTNFRMYRPDDDKAFPISAGDIIKFKAVQYAD